jgi:hypothetical protein
VLPFIAAGLLLLSPEAPALQIRNPSSGNYVWIGYLPTAPVLQKDFQPDAGIIRRGTGWPDGQYEWHRMLALVSPVHFIGVAHYPFDETTELRFLGSDGMVRGHALEGQEVVFHEGVATDVALGTLQVPVDPATGVEPYKVAHFATPQDYLNRSLLVVGKAGWAAPGSYDGFEVLVNNPGFDTTEYVYFDYSYAPGAPADTRFVGGETRVGRR